MTKHEQWSDGQDKRKKNQSSAHNASLSFENQAKKAPPPILFIFLILLVFVCAVFAIITKGQIRNRQTEELSVADKAFLAGDYKKAEAAYSILLTDLHNKNNSNVRNESFTHEKLALTQIAQKDFANAEKNLDQALDMHIEFIDNGPKIRTSVNQSLSEESNAHREAKHVLRVLNNKCQLFYIENKIDLVPPLVDQTWNKVLAQKRIQNGKDSIFRILCHAQMHNLEKRHLNSEAAALQARLVAVKALPKDEKPDRYISILKEQRPPANAQFRNCDFGVFSAQ